jgi:tetratricopeptide (TPR) repeat protein
MKSKDTAVIQIAAHGLWTCWLDEAGPEAREMMERGTEALERGELDLALSIFEALAEEHEDWAEATNKVATALYKMHRYRESMEACRKVVQAKPFHFGAWSGLAACAMQLADWKAARLAAEQILHIQPHSTAHHSLILEIEKRAADSGS